jgi:hypothetical protein
MGWGRGNSEAPIPGEGFLVGVHVALDCRLRPVADDLDEVVGSAEDPVLVVDGDIAEALDEVRGESRSRALLIRQQYHFCRRDTENRFSVDGYIRLH